MRCRRRLLLPRINLFTFWHRIQRFPLFGNKKSALGIAPFCIKSRSHADDADDADDGDHDDADDDDDDADDADDGDDDLSILFEFVFKPRGAQGHRIAPHGHRIESQAY